MALTVLHVPDSLDTGLMLDMIPKLGQHRWNFQP